MGAKTLLTVEQFEQLPESAGVSYELDQGELVEVARANYDHNEVRDHAAWLFRNYLNAYPGKGKVITEQWFQVGDGTVYAPDVALIGADQVSLIDRQRSIQPFSPVLAIEVTSPSNTFHELARKIQGYLDGGTKAVCVFETASREVRINSKGSRPRILVGDDTLQEPELLPGFSVRVADLFSV